MICIWQGCRNVPTKDTQVHQIIDGCTTQRMAVYFWTVDSLGLRLQETLNLHVGDIDSQRMMVNPHVHFIVPGGAVSNDGSRWLSTPANFLFPEPAASQVYRQKFREALRAADLEQNVDPAVWHRWWEVNVKPVGNGQAVLKYLALYVYRVAISDSRVVDCDETSVTFRFRPTKSRSMETGTVSGVRFVNRHTARPSWSITRSRHQVHCEFSERHDGGGGSRSARRPTWRRSITIMPG
jgi:Putative transposase